MSKDTLSIVIMILFGVLFAVITLFILFPNSKKRLNTRDLSTGDEDDVDIEDYEPVDYLLTIYNETDQVIITDEYVKIEPDAFQTFYFGIKRSSIILYNGVEFHDRQGAVETIDKENRVSCLGGGYFKKYGIPASVDFAFLILPPGQGDSM